MELKFPSYHPRVSIKLIYDIKRLNRWHFCAFLWDDDITFLTELHVYEIFFNESQRDYLKA